MVQGAKCFILNNSYMIIHVKCLWFGFSYFLSHMQHEQFSVAWVRLWMSSYHLGLPLVIVRGKATTWKKSNSYWNFIILYSIQNGCGHVCASYAMWLPVSLWRWVLWWDSMSLLIEVSNKTNLAQDKCFVWATIK